MDCGGGGGDNDTGALEETSPTFSPTFSPALLGSNDLDDVEDDSGGSTDDDLHSIFDAIGGFTDESNLNTLEELHPTFILTFSPTLSPTLFPMLSLRRGA